MLTDAKIRTAKPKAVPYKLTDSHGLYIEIRPKGTKLWRYRYRIAGKENIYALGNYPNVILADARTERDTARDLVKKGIHPAHNRQRQKAEQLASNGNTFEAVAREWLEANKPRWSPRYFDQITTFLEGDAFPHIGTLPIRSITAADLLAIIRRVNNRGAATVALLLRQWFSAIFRYAVSTLRADTDPASALKNTIQKPKTKHHKPLKDIPAFLKIVEEYGGYLETRIALKLALLVFVRPGELRQAEWQEVDFENKEWRVPESREKMGERHIVPLSRQALSLLRELHTLTGGRQFLFPNHRTPKTCMTATTLNRALERMGYAGEFSSHGFRATASTLLNEMNYRSDVIERQLAHKERNKSRAAYNRAELLPDRRAMMQDWADHMDRLKDGADVISFPVRVAS